jgi:aspartate-semialdehyde dehydrogenase
LKEVAILGATGVVGQRMVSLLQDHPWFKIGVLAASPRSVGEKYGRACKWIIEQDIRPNIAEMTIAGCDVESLEKAGSFDIVFSCLPQEIAMKVEESIASSYPVFSKASAHRLEKDVPLVVPEVNPDHLSLIEVQRERRKWMGFVSTDPNCSTIELVMSLKPLLPFGVSRVVVSTMQALSGAGYPGVASLDILANVIPFISGEEEKIEKETLKVLGSLNGEEVENAHIPVSASCCRVDVRNGHTMSVFVELEDKPDLQQIRQAFQSFRGVPQTLRLPSAPEHPIVVRDEVDRPQPVFDVNEGNGMSVVVGRIRDDPVLTVKFVCLGHNTIRGAAGSMILSAELAVARGYV